MYRNNFGRELIDRFQGNIINENKPLFSNPKKFRIRNLALSLACGIGLTYGVTDFVTLPDSFASFEINGSNSNSYGYQKKENSIAQYNKKEEFSWNSDVLEERLDALVPSLSFLPLTKQTTYISQDEEDEKKHETKQNEGKTLIPISFSPEHNYFFKEASQSQLVLYDSNKQRISEKTLTSKIYPHLFYSDIQYPEQECRVIKELYEDIYKENCVFYNK